MQIKIIVVSAALLIAGSSGTRADDVPVYQEGKKFSEAEVNIKTGENVTFTNKDPVTHNVYSSTPNMSFDLKTQKPGASTTITFDHVGDAKVLCAIHPQMSMTVHVH